MKTVRVIADTPENLEDKIIDLESRGYFIESTPFAVPSGISPLVGVIMRLDYEDAAEINWAFAEEQAGIQIEPVYPSVPDPVAIVPEVLGEQVA